jgi:hypothetical protein
MDYLDDVPPPPAGISHGQILGIAENEAWVLNPMFRLNAASPQRFKQAVRELSVVEYAV